MKRYCIALILWYAVTGVSAAQTTTLIDDFEDAGLGRPENIQNELFGYWFTYDDRRNNGGNSVAAGPTFVSPGAEGSDYCIHFSYTLGADFEHRFAGMATNLGPHIPSGKRELDLSDVTAMSLNIKGSGTTVFITFQSPLNVENNYLCYTIDSTPRSWEAVTIRIPRDLEHQWEGAAPSWNEVRGHISAIQFKAASKKTGEQGELWVDDIVLHGVTHQQPTAIVEPQPTDMGEIFVCDFEQASSGVYTHDDLRRDWNAPDYSNGVLDERGEIVATDRGKSLKVLYPAGGTGPHETGVQWITYFKNAEGQGVSYDSLYASYVVKAPAGFDGVKGGKLPGLGGGTAPSGGVPVDGTGGFSARLMWRSNSSGADGANDYLCTYMYYMDKATQWGRNLWWNEQPASGWHDTPEQWSPGGKVHLTPGKWDTLTIKIRINTPGFADGQALAWLNGKPVLANRSIRYRAAGINAFKVGLFYFSTFFGGSTPDWAPGKDEYLLFDDFCVSTDPFDYLEAMPVAVRPPKASPMTPAAAVAFLRRSNKLRIHLDKTERIAVFDFQGNRLFHAYAEKYNSTITVPLNSYAAGTYICHVTSKNGACRHWRFCVR